MPSFDIVSEVNMQETDNAVNSVKREIVQRYDFKGSNSSVERDENEITVLTSDDYKLKAITEMLKVHFIRRNIEATALDFKTPSSATNNMIRQKILIKQGISQEISKKIIKEIKSKKLKVQAAIRGEELRVTGAKRDVLQDTIAIVKEINVELPLQFINFRD